MPKLSPLFAAWGVGCLVALAEAIRSHGHRDVRYVPEFDEIVETLPDELRPGDLLLVLGAGNVSSLGPRVLAALEARSTTGRAE